MRWRVSPASLPGLVLVGCLSFLSCVGVVVAIDKPLCLCASDRASTWRGGVCVGLRTSRSTRQPSPFTNRVDAYVAHTFHMFIGVHSLSASQKFAFSYLWNVQPLYTELCVRRPLLRVCV